MPTLVTWRLPVVVGLAVAVVVALGAGARATSDTRTTADEPHYLLTATSLWEDRDLDVADERAALRYLPYHEVALPMQATVQPDGRQVAPHDPLLSALLAAPTGLGGWLGAKLALAATAGVLAAALVWAAVQRFQVPPGIAAVTVLLAGASPPLAVYGTQVYPELVAGLATLVGFLAVTTPSPTTRSSLPVGAVVVAVLAVSALPWLSVKYAPVAAVLAGALLWRLRASTAAALVVVVALVVSGLVDAAGHQLLYGGWTAYASGSHFGAGELTVVGSSPDYAARSVRLAGLLVDRWFGLVPWQPAAVALPLALGAMVGGRRWVAGGSFAVLTLVATVVAGWATATWVALTMHGWWWPGRQVVVVLPLGVLAVAWWAATLSSRGRTLLAALGLAGVVSYGLAVVAVVTSDLSLIVDLERLPNPAGWLLRPLLPDLRADRVLDTVLLVLWAAGLLAGAVAAGRQAARVGDPTAVTVAERAPAISGAAP